MTDIREICNLSDEEFNARRAGLNRGLVPKVRERRELPDGVVVSFDATPAMRDDLDAFVAFEGKCCPSVGISVREAGSALELEIRGIDPSASLFAGVGQPTASQGGAAAAGSGGRRVLTSAGLGALGALIVCCVLPIALVAALGTAVAAPLTKLDNPWLISSSALVFAAAIWFWQRRRDDAAVETSAGGCGC